MMEKSLYEKVREFGNEIVSELNEMTLLQLIAKGLSVNGEVVDGYILRVGISTHRNSTLLIDIKEWSEISGVSVRLNDGTKTMVRILLNLDGDEGFKMMSVEMDY